MTELVERERRKGGRELEVDMLKTKLSCWSHPSWVFMLRHRQDLLIKRSIVAFSLTLVARWKQDAHSDARGGMDKKEQLVATADVGRSQILHWRGRYRINRWLKRAVRSKAIKGGL